MPIVKKLDDRMTVNIESWKKEKIRAMASEERISESSFVLRAVDYWLERHNGEISGGS